MKFAICELPIFKRHVLLAVDCAEEAAIAYFWEYARQKKVSELPGLIPQGGCGGWCQTRNHDSYLWVRNDSSAVILHEIVHAAFHACEDVGMQIDQEMIARLVEYMKLNLMDELKDVT